MSDSDSERKKLPDLSLQENLTSTEQRDSSGDPPLLAPEAVSTENSDSFLSIDSENNRIKMGDSGAIVPPPAPLSLEGNVAENWKRWRRRFENYLAAMELDEASETRKVSLLLHIAGEEAMEKFETFDITAENKKKIAEVYKAFETYCSPKVNESVERQVFFNRVQGSGETFKEFLADLRKLSQSCNFGTLKESLIKDRIISGIRDTNTKDRLLRQEDLDLEKCIKICNAAEITVEHIKTMAKDNTINMVTSKSCQNKNRENQQSGKKNFGSKQNNSQKYRGQSASGERASVSGDTHTEAAHVF